MQDTVFITERGTLTIPADLRKSLGLKGGQQFIVTALPTGELMLRPAATVPIEIYSEARITEFAEEEEALGTMLGSRADGNV